jgi:hypothetical protein
MTIKALKEITHTYINLTLTFPMRSSYCHTQHEKKRFKKLKEDMKKKSFYLVL